MSNFLVEVSKNNNHVFSLLFYLKEKEIVDIYLIHNNDNQYYLSDLSPIFKNFNYFSLIEKQNALIAYLKNMLPEHQFFKTQNQDKNTLFNLFEKADFLGNDINGVFNFSIKKEVKKIKSSSHLYLIKEEELFDKINKSRLENEDFVIWQNKPRLSVAGIQPKINVLIKDKDMFLVDFHHNLSSTHILKIESQSNPVVKNLIENEYISLKIAKTIGLNVADVSYHSISKFTQKEKFLLIKRFDREYISNKDTFVEKVNKKHVIDGACLLGVLPTKKYQRKFDDKTSLSSFSSFLDKENRIELAKQVIFNLIIGNVDNHLKNISFFYEKNLLSLTPLYDVLNIAMYKDEIDDTFSLFIGNATCFDELEKEDFLKLADDLKIDKEELINLSIDILNKTHQCLNDDKFLLTIFNNNTEILQDHHFISFFEHYKTSVFNHYKRLSFLLDSLQKDLNKNKDNSNLSNENVGKFKV